MISPVVTFTSKHGSTRRYATALAEQFGTRAVELPDLADLTGSAAASEADPLIVLAPLYATKIRGRRRIIRAIRSAPGRAALVVVGMSPTNDPGRTMIRLGPLDRALMSVLRSRLRRTPDEPAAGLILAHAPIRFVDESTLDPVATWANGPTELEV